MTFPFVLLTLVSIVVIIFCVTHDDKPVDEETMDRRSMYRRLDDIADQIRLSRRD